jgi:hypothetical protein
VGREEVADGGGHPGDYWRGAIGAAPT